MLCYVVINIYQKWLSGIFTGLTAGNQTMERTVKVPHG